MTAPTAPAGLPVTTREQFDGLLEWHVARILGSVEQDATEEEYASAVEDAELVEATARAFADAADRALLLDNGQPVPYGSLVVIYGDRGPLAVRLADYDRNPVYWQAKAGEVDGVVFGNELIGQLRAT